MSIAKWLPWVVLVALAAPAALAFKTPSRDEAVFASPIPPQFQQKAVDEKNGTLSWRTLAQVATVKQRDKFVPQFSEAVLAFDNRQVRLQGFMMPLTTGDQHKTFLLSAQSPSCPFCLPGGPDSLVEVQARAPMRFGEEPMILAGRLQVLRNDPGGLYYRLVDATPVAAR
ncbi:MAG: DUF3299 domain-containing protein [bacterium]|jgi:hypothetical protein|nr:DUF3299 domain-containing protein [Betaproteobacteria bacterium]